MEDEEIINFIRYVRRASEAELRQLFEQIHKSETLIQFVKNIISSSDVP